MIPLYRTGVVNRHLSGGVPTWENKPEYSLQAYFIYNADNEDTRSTRVHIRLITIVVLWLTDRFIDQSIDQLIDSLIDCLIICQSCFQALFSASMIMLRNDDIEQVCVCPPTSCHTVSLAASMSPFERLATFCHCAICARQTDRQTDGHQTNARSILSTTAAEITLTNCPVTSVAVGLVV